ncbi:DUF3182 family protein [Cupriavidus pinatubonensis]|uniref:DUF3182 family protein n=1 Tax=Cupriavidus pinatubonensis TaxID=248026 RepID=UPI001C732967|nr:DUF3182 family protein [Cupriavidus pinatubonensis]QYY27934.1 DUF3182 family protein [Cupriavidus pinatubonensis]
MPATNNKARQVMVYGCARYGQPDSHQAMTLEQIGRNVAKIGGYGFSGAYEHSATARTPAGGTAAPYLVPLDTVVGDAQAQALHLRSADDLFGGVVPFAFVATKVISHGLVAPDAVAPAGWNPDFAQRAGAAVLPGFTAFSLEDARSAGLRLMAGGVVRLKDPCGIGGLGQQTVDSEAALDAALAAMSATDIESHGLVLERDLDSPDTYSVGQILVAGVLASYCGTQDLTVNNTGEEVYGGSTLAVVRGGFDALLAQPFGPRALSAIRAAMAYHDAALACYPGMVLSRCNYDVAFGVPVGATGEGAARALTGVLEQSWRVGGATGAELAALRALKADPARERVVAATREVYGPDAHLPAGAELYFQGEDRHVGLLTKYAYLESDNDGHP